MRFSAQAILAVTYLQDADGIAVAKEQGYVQVKSKFSGLNRLFGCENYKYGCGYTKFVTQEVGAR